MTRKTRRSKTTATNRLQSKRLGRFRKAVKLINRRHAKTFRFLAG